MRRGPYAGRIGLGHMLGDGPVTSDGARWRGVRRILQPEWTAGRADTMVGRLLAGAALAEEEPVDPRGLLRVLLATIVLAGTGTTAAALFWLLHHLALHPEALARLRKELAAAPPGSWSDVVDRRRYPWLDACVPRRFSATDSGEIASVTRRRQVGADG